MKKIRFGVIGAGGIADRRTIPGMKLARNAELTAVMELNPTIAEQLRVKHGAKRAYSDAAALLADPEVDAVYIASPVVTHAGLTRQAAAAGKHILLEKPIAMTCREGKELLDVCASCGVQAAAGFMMRFGTQIMNMKRAIAEGRIGKVVSGYSQFTLWLPEQEGNWRQIRAKSGGGPLMDMGVHCIDLIEYVTGMRIRRVGGFNKTISFRYDVEDTSTVMLELENGAQCVVQTNFNIPDEVAKWRLEFFGMQGRLLGENIIGQNDGGTVNAIFLEGSREYDPQQDHADLQGEMLGGEFGNMYTREVESFADSLLNGTPLEVPARDALHVQHVIELAYRSSQENRIFKVDDL